MTILTTPEQYATVREGGRRLATILARLVSEVRSGVRTIDFDIFAKKWIEEGGDEPAFLNYRPDGSKKTYPATICVSVNEEVVHGIPGERMLKNGDIVGLDLGLRHEGFYVDAAVTVPVGNIDEKSRALIEVTKSALDIGIGEAKIGNTIGDIGYAIESFVRPLHYGIVKELTGHGIGRKLHEPPYVPNYGDRSKGIKLEVGMMLALEPMFNIGSAAVRLMEDMFTYVTRDGERSAHFEHTVIVGKEGGEAVTAASF